MQSFLYRAILCDFNTLFVVEILESFSNFQHNKMYSYINNILSIKFGDYKKKNGKKKVERLDKSKSREYLDSYIVFVYKKLENENAFKNELGKYTRKEEVKKEEDIRPSILITKESQNLDINVSQISNKNDSVQDDEFSKSKIIIPPNFDIIKNIKVISSDVCGLGKSFKIKKEIDKEGKKYYHFPLGGKLTKKVIYKKYMIYSKK